MRKQVLLAGAAVAVCVAAALYFRLLHRAAPGSDSLRNSLAPEITKLLCAGERGDCEAAEKLARYYLDEALDLKCATRWLRSAARCPGARYAGSRELLAYYLMHDKDDPAIAAEITALIGEIRSANPAKAAELEEQLKSHSP